MTTIGIDMSKGTFHASFDDSRVEIFTNDEVGIKKFLVTLVERGYLKDSTLIGTEATGVYHLLFCQLLHKTGWSVKVINPLITHRMINTSLRKVKTDHHDALAIRQTLLIGAGYFYTDAPEVLALKTLVQEREALCKMRAQIKQRQQVHQLREQAANLLLHNSYRGPLKLLSYEIRLIEKKMTEYLPETQKLLRSIPGIGQVSATALIASIGDIRRFPDAEKLTAYLGLDCRVHQSGTSIHGKGYISKRGNRYLRYVLFNAAFIAKRRNPELKQYFQKKIGEGKHYFSALCAVERKLVHLIYAVWRRGTPFIQR